MVCLGCQDSPVLLAPFSLPLNPSFPGQSHVHMHLQDALIVLASSDTYIQTLNEFTCLVYSHRFYLQNKSLKHPNQIIYTCIFISKIIQYLSVLCISSFVHRILLRLASLGIACGLRCQVSTQATPQHQIINVHPVHPHVNWAWSFTMTISRSRIYCGSSGISQPNIHLYQHTLISTITLTPQPLTTTIYLLPFSCQHKQHKQ